MTRAERLASAERNLATAERWTASCADARNRRDAADYAQMAELYMGLGAVWAQLGDATWDGTDVPA